MSQIIAMIWSSRKTKKKRSNKKPRLNGIGEKSEDKNRKKENVLNTLLLRNQTLNNGEKYSKEIGDKTDRKEREEDTKIEMLNKRKMRKS